jgi:hypothetical protein
VFLANLSQTQTGAPVPDDCDAVDIERRSADSAAIELGAAHACANAFYNQGPFKFRDR